MVLFLSTEVLLYAEFVLLAVSGSGLSALQHTFEDYMEALKKVSEVIRTGNLKDAVGTSRMAPSGRRDMATEATLDTEGEGTGHDGWCKPVGVLVVGCTPSA